VSSGQLLARNALAQAVNVSAAHGRESRSQHRNKFSQTRIWRGAAGRSMRSNWRSCSHDTEAAGPWGGAR